MTDAAGFGCEDGAEVACGFAQSVHCGDCGCEAGEYCSTRPASNGACQPTLAVGVACTADAECVSGDCVDVGNGMVCSGPCDGTSCPGLLTCGVGTDGEPECRPTCSGTARSDGFGCVNDEEVACAHVSSPVHCSDCGCAAGSFCSTLSDSDGECLAPRAVGEICKEHTECAGANCSAADIDGAEGECQPVRGTACTPENCTSCDGDQLFGRYCAQSCTDVSDCAAGEHCFGNSTTMQYWCRTDCTDFTFCGTDFYCHYYNSQVSVCLP